jgi:hypothetical protein
MNVIANDGRWVDNGRRMDLHGGFPLMW